MAEDEKVRVDAKATNAKCENCGSNLKFDPNSGCLKCASCGSTFNINVTKEFQNHPLADGLKDDFDGHKKWSESERIVKCDTCGAEVKAKGLNMTTSCEYCQNDYVLDVKGIKGLKLKKLKKKHQLKLRNIIVKELKRRFLLQVLLKSKFLIVLFMVFMLQYSSLTIKLSQNTLVY